MKIEWSRNFCLFLEGPGGEMSDSQPWSGMQNHPQMRGHTAVGRKWLCNYFRVLGSDTCVLNKVGNHSLVKRSEKQNSVLSILSLGLVRNLDEMPSIKLEMCGPTSKKARSLGGNQIPAWEDMGGREKCVCQWDCRREQDGDCGKSRMDDVRQAGDRTWQAAGVEAKGTP